MQVSTGVEHPHRRAQSIGVQGLDAVMFTPTTDTRDINGYIVYVHPLLGGAIGKGLLGIMLADVNGLRHIT